MQLDGQFPGARLLWNALEWLLFNAKWAIIKLYHGENKLHFNEKMMMSAVNQTNTHCWIFKVLAHWNNSPQVDTPLH
jgi:hypothetical protein